MFLQQGTTLRRGPRRHCHPGPGLGPFTPDNLPEYAGRIFDYCRQHPEVIRLATWHRMERAGQDPASMAPTREAKLEALAAAQQQSGLGADFSPSALLTIVSSIALAWDPTTVTSVPASATEADTIAERRAAIVEAVRRLL
ncbi:hypothetical protein [Nocardia cyriacigeorgica]|uniref:hypothetical protein n=1 Tax=Nocardia cyriacigeorgica TaxID=135487 RepID=UPI0039814475